MKRELAEFAGKSPVQIVLGVVLLIAAVFGSLVDLTFGLGAALVGTVVALALREWNHRRALAAERITLSKQFEQTATTTDAPFRTFLDRLTESNREGFTEDVRIDYFIPKRGLERTVRRATTRPFEHQSVFWRRVRLAPLGDGVSPGVQSVRVKAGQTPLEYVLIPRVGGTDVVLAFDEAVVHGANGAALEWMLEYERPGTWDPLRTTGKDEFYFKTTCASEYHEVRLTFQGWKHPPSSLSCKPRVGTVTTEQSDDGLHVLVWRVENPKVGLEHRAWFEAG